ncbi:5'-nucleotidase C-terminal domain-containing protein [Leeuwenhoekiella polynyae]|uniref:5'-nucleotidase-like protein n=1 Tax=Leeuwenhoekiella polynyae TaxID=1550906 RepID=A0A4Q0PC79_9FLAO|nr:5'-nucleotidase [Leeuwenhoekiella polynyae]RXG23976.1 5'-nucleotidase-like protein [Leeuwenhoekiella polynyae]
MIRIFLSLVLTISLLGCKDSQATLTHIESHQLPVTDSIQANQDVLDYIAPYRKRIDEEMSAVLAYAPQSLSKKEGPYNTAIGNMMADAVFKLSNPVFKKRTGKNIDAVLLNHGGIRSTLNAGDVTMRSAFDIMPFENSVVVVELTSDQVNEMFDYLKSGTAHPISNMQLVLDEKNEIKTATINGNSVENSKTYFIATNDYLQQGGDHMTFLSEPLSMEVLDYKIRSILVDYFKEQDTIAPVRDNRFIKE